MGMSFSAFSRRKHVSAQAVGKAADTGRLRASIVTDPQGRRSIGNIALADKEWQQNAGKPAPPPPLVAVERLSVFPLDGTVIDGGTVIVLAVDHLSKPDTFDGRPLLLSRETARALAVQLIEVTEGLP